ncbi:hypothetical protein EJ110_NYTH25519 [Nymphaea thermarum]|nr:hypothetical protein EJ110_NYTH25519 [Nymphaea thermarum]
MADVVLPAVADVQETGSNLKGENVPIHVTSIRLNKDTYLSWSAALEIGITSRGRLQYITGEKPASAKNDPQWATWTLEDNQTFIFLGGLRDEFESVRSQLLNCDEIPGIEEVYARVEAEEQRRQIMHIDTSHGSSPTAFVSRTAEQPRFYGEERLCSVGRGGQLPAKHHQAGAVGVLLLPAASLASGGARKIGWRGLDSEREEKEMAGVDRTVRKIGWRGRGQDSERELFKIFGLAWAGTHTCPTLAPPLSLAKYGR